MPIPLLGRMLPEAPASIQEMMSRLGQLPGQQAISGLAQRQMVPQALPQELPPEMMAQQPMPGMTVGGLARGAAGALPILGEAMDVQEMIRGIQERSPGRAAMGAAGLALPFVGFSGIFAGARSAGADKALLAQAEKLAKEGESAEKIWQDTGWWVKTKEGPSPPGGQPRYEIPDRPAKFLPKVAKRREATRMEDVLQHPELFQAYPELGRAPFNPISGLPYEASWDPSTGMLMQKELAKYATAGKGLSTHELQHGVQQLEGLPRGGDPDEMMALGVRPEVADEIYRRLAGEAEARAAMSRMGFTPAERRAFPPWQSYDVPLEQLIVRPNQPGPVRR